MVCEKLDKNSITMRLIVLEDTIVKVAVNSLIHTLAILFTVYSISVAVAQLWAIAWNCSLSTEEWMEKHVEGSGHGLISGIWGHSPRRN